MTDGDSIAQLAVVILLLGMAVPALATAHTYSGSPFEYTETVTVVDNGSTTVSENATNAEGYSETVTIVTKGTTLTEGDDYEWYPANGTIHWYNTQASNDGDDATITYSAYQRTRESSMAWSIVSLPMGLFGIYGLVAAVRALWSYVAEVWDLV